MNITKCNIEGLLVIEPDVFKDKRGYFFESYSKKKLQDTGFEFDFVQDNESCSQRGTIRGLHFQKQPHAQGKLIRVVKGAVYDVAVDIRKNSPTYGQWFGVVLDELNKKIFWIPAGFAHGFQCLEDNTVFQYKCTDYYHPECEDSILWNDADLNIQWQNIEPVISEKDAKARSFKSYTQKLNQ